MHTVGVPVVDVASAAGVSTVAEGTAVDVITCTVGDGVNVGIGNGVSCGLQAERINKINPMYWNFFICIFLWKYYGQIISPQKTATINQARSFCPLSCLQVVYCEKPKKRYTIKKSSKGYLYDYFLY
jgi:hypothetical protein